MNKSIHCEFCDEFRGGSRNMFTTWYGAEERTVIETDHLRVVPSLGHFAKGYLLLVPKFHYCALADTPPEIMCDVIRVKLWLVRELSPVYGDYVFFEHGARTEDSGGCGIDHAHLHALPLKGNGVLRYLKEQFAHAAIKSLADLSSAVTAKESYLYYEESPGCGWIFFPAVLPSQYMRRLVAEAAGIARWDWRCSGREDSLLATRAEVTRMLVART